MTLGSLSSRRHNRTQTIPAFLLQEEEQQNSEDSYQIGDYLRICFYIQATLLCKQVNLNQQIDKNFKLLMFMHRERLGIESLVFSHT